MEVSRLNSSSVRLVDAIRMVVRGHILNLTADPTTN